MAEYRGRDGSAGRVNRAGWVVRVVVRAGSRGGELRSANGFGDRQQPGKDWTKYVLTGEAKYDPN